MMRRKVPFFGPPPDSELADQNQQDYARQVTKALQLQQRSPARIHKDIDISLQLDDLGKTEFDVLRGRYRFGVLCTAAAVAGQKAWVQLTPAPGRLTIIESIILTNNTGTPQQSYWGMASSIEAGGAIRTPGALDDRAGNASAATVVKNGTAVVPTSGAAFSYAIIPVSSSIIVPVNIILTGAIDPAAGTVWTFKTINNTVNQQDSVSVVWSERALLPSETS